MTKQQAQDLPLEKAIERAEVLAEKMESGNLSLEELITSFEEGSRLINHCQQQLAAAEKRVEVVLKQPGGEVTTTPLEEENS